MTDKALERARLRDAMRALAGESIVVSIGSISGVRAVGNLAKHLPAPYTGDVEAMTMTWYTLYRDAQYMIDGEWGFCLRDGVPTDAMISFEGLGNLIRFVRWLDSLEEPPVVKCGRCKQWVAASKAGWLGNDWPDPGYYCRGCLPADSVREAFAQNPEWFFPLPAKGFWRL